ncbi:MAG: hypothetical protein AB8G96_06150 [Phycisphaerales bacterium]
MAAGPTRTTEASPASLSPGTPPAGIAVSASAWSKGRNILVARMFLAHLILVGVPLGTGVVMDIALGRPVSGEGGSLVRLLPFIAGDIALVAARAVAWIAVLGGLAFIGGHAWREYRRSAPVAEADGLVDPVTLKPVDPDVRGGANARAYWWTWMITGESPAHFARRRTEAMAGRPSAGLQIVTDTVVAFAAPVLLLVGAPALVVMFIGGSMMTAGLVPAAAAVLLIAVHLLPRLAVPAEVPTGRCSGCGHHRLARSNRCPECGAELEAAHGSAGRSRRCRRTVHASARRDNRTRRTTAGLGLIIAGAWVISLFGLDPAARALRTSRAIPTSAMIADLQSGTAWDAARFSALLQRPLDAASRQRLAAALLNRRAVGAETRPAAWAWFDSQTEAGALAPATIEARWSGRIEPVSVLMGPLDRDGQSRHLGLRFLRRIEPGATDRAGFVVRSVRIDGGEPWTPTDRHGQPLMILRGRAPAAADWLSTKDRWSRPWPAPPEEIALIPLRSALPDRQVVPVEIELVRFVARSAEVDVSYDVQGDAIPRGDIVWSEASMWQTKLSPPTSDDGSPAP